MYRALAVATTCILTLVACAHTSEAIPAHTRVQTYRSGLNFPVDMAWIKGTKKIFFTEKTGNIRVMHGKKLASHPCAHLDVNSDGERGLLGIVLDPHFTKNHRLYVYYTNASPLQNRVARFVVHHNQCGHKKDLITGISASSSGYHNGGQLEFVKGKLFVSVGEAHDAGNAQDKSKRLGKILRINPDGSIPRGNPFGHNPVWSYGHRNPFGLARRPGTNVLYESENGPDCDDEINIITKGRNYGWGNGYQCGTAGVGPNPKPPLIRWNPTIAPTDLTWYSGRAKALNGSLYIGDYNNSHLHRLVLNRKGTNITADRIIYTASSGITDVSKGPGGWLYFMTTGSIMRIVAH